MAECDYASVTGNCDNVTRTLREASGTDADHYLELGFLAAASSLAPGATSGEAQIRIHNAGYESMSQTDDYSFDATMAWTPSMQVTVLAWGMEP